MIKNGLIMAILFSQVAGVATAAPVKPARDRIAYISYAYNDPEGEQIYSINRDGTGMTRVSLKHDGRAEREWLQQSPDGKCISYLSKYYSDTSSQYSFDIVSADGLERYSFPAAFDYDIRPAWSPKGDRIAYVEATPAYRGDIEYHHIRILKLADKSVTPVASGIQDIGDIASLCWSPDGRKLLCSMALIQGDGGYDLYVIDAAGGETANLTNASAYYRSPSWSKDGRKILFTSNRAGSIDVYIMNEDGRGLKSITRSSEDEFAPSWSPDGSRISWLKSRPGRPGARSVLSGICIADAAGNLLHDIPEDFGPLLSFSSWAPDGSAILTGYRDSSGDNLALIDARTGEKNYLTNGQCAFFGEDEGGIRWLPDGSAVAFQGRMNGRDSSDIIVCDLRTKKLLDLTSSDLPLSWEGFSTSRK